MPRIYISEKQLKSTGNSASPFPEWERGARSLISNCLAFASNALYPDISDLEPGKYEVTIPDPGCMSGKSMNRIRGNSLRDALVFDDYVATPYDDQRKVNVPQDHYLMAAYASPFGIMNMGSYHLYRRHEESGIWYHLPGWGGRVTNLDASRRIIANPQTANHYYSNHNYCQFAGFFLMSNAGMQLGISIRKCPENPVLRSMRRGWVQALG